MFTYYGAQRALESLSNGYVCLFTAEPSQSGGFTNEVSGNGYSRKAIGGFTTDQGIAKNTKAITFDEPTGSWGTVTHFGIASSSSDGSLLYYGALKDASTQTQGVSIGPGYIFLIRANGLEIRLDASET